MTVGEAGYRLDDLDRCIIYNLMQEGRATATSIAENTNVSGATVRNRIEKLEDLGIITGYRAHIDFETAGGKLRNLYLCNVPVPEREALAHEARAIQGVINVRSLMTGRRNLHILAVGESTKDLQRISRNLSKLGIEIEDEDLLEEELFDPYEPFNPNERQRTPALNDFINLTGNAKILTVSIADNAPVAGMSLEEANQTEVLDEETLIISIERDNEEIMPHGDTVIQPDDIVTLLSRHRTDALAFAPFQTSPKTETTT
ncbi:DNA-binding transcriptional regulator, Lrp family [Haladaptatus litoreus]|uniref:DNA-binding transcriptional regulator, Lrp family n=1 Tax=Haladaptatus litoreus TaxID=553468 RepID=A0A1N7CXU1_9EURY|nr:Lrp/AsnC family transcriptional regulator [Haladaptatus litoreus]SIR68360.1 DNA-binding transcriptional regulator, Lrp family [Haladaptatus litoreus]